MDRRLALVVDNQNQNLYVFVFVFACANVDCILIDKGWFFLLSYSNLHIFTVLHVYVFVLCIVC